MSLPVQLAGCRDCGQTLYNCILCILICVKASPRVFNIFVSLASFALLVPPNSDLAKYSVSVCVCGSVLGALETEHSVQLCDY